MEWLNHFNPFHSGGFSRHIDIKKSNFKISNSYLEICVEYDLIWQCDISWSYSLVGIPFNVLPPPPSASYQFIYYYGIISTQKHKGTDAK